jgi:hypothetical protein
MRYILLFSLLLFSIISCNTSSNDNSGIKTKPLTNGNTKAEKLKDNSALTFNFNAFGIHKESLGPITIGMTMANAEKEVSQLTKKECEAYDLGYDGGGKAYIYSWKNQPVLAFVPKRDSEEIIAIIALHKNLKTRNGLHPNSTVKEIQQKYPDITINQNLMMEWEYMFDEENNWDFVFMTNENNTIGIYKELEVPTKPVKTETAMNWITIK